VRFPQGYGMVRSLQRDANTSWGGSIIEANGKFHMYVNAIGNQCLLDAWMRNSRIDHVVSETVEGPYTFVDTAVNMTSSNPAVVVLPQGSGPFQYALFHIYNGTVYQPWVDHCFPNGSRMPRPPHSLDPRRRPSVALPSGEGGVWASGERRVQSSEGDNWVDHQISVLSSLDGPWQLLQPAPGHALPRCNNPAPWAHPNGTLYALCEGVIYRPAHHRPALAQRLASHHPRGPERVAACVAP